MKRLFILLFSAFCALVVPLSSRAQDMDFTTGVDSSSWVLLTDYNDVESSMTMVDLGFDFCFLGYYYNQISIDINGSIFFGRKADNYDNDGRLKDFASPCIVPFGTELWKHRTSWYAHWAILGTEGNHVVVCDFKLVPHNMYAVDNRWRRLQVRLYEADNSVTLHYGPMLGIDTTTAEIGLVGDSIWAVDQTTDTVTHATPRELPSNRTWPGAYRYYTFTPRQQPVCGAPRRVDIVECDDDEVTLSWPRSAYDSLYTIAYTPRGSALPTMLTTADTFLNITGLPPLTLFDYNLSTTCKNGNTSIVRGYNFKTICEDEARCHIHYWELAGENTQCYIGNWQNPNYEVMAVGNNPRVRARHEVNIDTNAVDPYTGGQLSMIPPGHCVSVRLGNDDVNAEEEAIVYTLHIDTNNFGLIILNYALVEENPGHPIERQPKFTLLITDLNDVPISACHDINFVAGTGDGWNISHFTDANNARHEVTWLDWQTIGLDLSQLHRRTIKLKLENHDCLNGGHFGYAYFNLETAQKNIHASTCGEEFDTMTFYAPKGFTYRWFEASDPQTTLSTDDSLRVTEPGTYTCEAMFMGSSTCGFTLTSYAGPRFPAARPRVYPMDDCHTQFLFEDHSVIARDQAHTQLTTQQCDESYWRFDDGTISHDASVTRTFTPGEHWVELVATLSDGQCRDSVRITLDVGHVVVEVTDSICDGGHYDFHGQRYTEPGDYELTDNCIQYYLHLGTYHLYHREVEDTMCEGQVYRFGSHYLDSSGVYNLNDTTIHGCDSTHRITLWMRPRPSGNHELFQTCHGEAYYYLKGHFTEAEQQVDGAQTFVADDGVQMRWQPSVPYAPKLYYGPDSLLRLKVDSYTTYYVSFQYADEPQCPMTDTLVIKPVTDIEARMEVTPKWLNIERLDFTAKDMSINAMGRYWYIDGEEQPETTVMLNAKAAAEADSVRIMLKAYNNSCEDSVTESLAVHHPVINFPNAFTPSRATNNTFGPVGKQVSDYELWIYDRRGDLVFHTTDFDHRWDGTHNGNICKQDTYVYTCTYTTSENDRKRHTGTVTLIR